MFLSFLIPKEDIYCLIYVARSITGSCLGEFFNVAGAEIGVMASSFIVIANINV